MPEQRERAMTAADLPRCWRRWAGAVAGCARRRVPPWLTAPSYAAAYREVAEACRAAAADAVGEQREFYESLEQLVRPWVALDVLLRTDAELLADVARRCEDAGRRLRGRGARPPRREALQAGTVALVVVLLLAAAATFALDWWPASLTQRIRGLANQVWYTWGLLGQTNQLLVLAGLVGFLLVVLVLRRARG